MPVGPARDPGRGARHRPDRAALAQAARHGDDPRLARAHAQGGHPRRVHQLGRRRRDRLRAHPRAVLRPARRARQAAVYGRCARAVRFVDGGRRRQARLGRGQGRLRLYAQEDLRRGARGEGARGEPAPSLRRPSTRCAPSAGRATRLLLHRTASRRGGGGLWTFARLERALRCARADRARCGWVGGGGRCGCKSNGRVVSDVFGGDSAPWCAGMFVA
mmetsp:Transcript_29952/g.100108  ORF Transcript_29952/g.100108 Transcript_29952/m.100108 type:complete len:218 (-) Transcript_29952:38-691(-)